MRDGITPWPQELADRYRELGYWRDQPMSKAIWAWADSDNIALVDGDLRLSYRDLLRRADGLAIRLLDEAKLRTGDTVLTQLPNTWEFVVLTLALLRAGIAPVMALPAHRGQELRHIANHGRVSAIAVPDRIKEFDHRALGAEVVADTPTAHTLLVAGDPGENGLDLREMARPADDWDAARARLDALEIDPADVAVFLLSGGTTGLPKLICRTHNDFDYNARRSAEVCGFDEKTVYLVVIPAAHNFSLACPGLLGALIVGGTVVMCPSPRPEVAFPIMERESVTVTALVPAVAQRWLDAVEHAGQPVPSSLTLLQVGASRLASQHAARIGPVMKTTLQQVYGMAEGLLNYTALDDPDDVLVNTQGRPMCPDDEIRIVDPAGETVADGEMGELLTRGPYTPRGYFDAPEHNVKSFAPGGWYRTGDIVRMHPSGNLVVEGRAKDIIIRGGENISAEEVENLVYQVPGVSAVAVVAYPDEALGERVCAVVVPEAGATVELEQVRDRLAELDIAAFKVPERLVLVSELPKTKVGKLDKATLRKMINEPA
ncbi:(2,3-dihydroxybenzoyl)adenylate synthase [Streptomyces malaysiensis]|uniref:(2,3-dihydroxybenzoyl)adenylate synthase n=1 Tax=Streptomyces malaysiensis TaxID=92644 RepID=UPI0034012952